MRASFIRQCPCCGATFTAKHQAAKWCSSRCSMRAYQRRRRGMPEADPGVSLVTAVVQPQILDDVEMPAAWAYPEPIVANGLESRYWHGTAIKRRQADGFVNATQMAKANGKHLPHYMANDRTRDYIAALAAVVGIPTTDLMEIRQGGQPHLQGTWIHPRLAVDLARWISPAFAVWMDGWFLESFTQPHQQQLPMKPGVHVFATSRRQACELWHAAIQDEVSYAVSRLLNPRCLHDAALPYSSRYSYEPLTA